MKIKKLYDFEYWEENILEDDEESQESQMNAMAKCFEDLPFVQKKTLQDAVNNQTNVENVQIDNLSQVKNSTIRVFILTKAFSL